MPNLKDHMIFIVLGFLLVPMNQLLAMAGLYYASPLVAGIIQPINVVFTAAISIMLKNENASILKIVGILLSVLGAVAMVVINGLTSETGASVALSWTGVLGPVLYLIAGLAFAIYLNIQRTLFNRNLPIFTVTMWCYFYGTIMCGIVSLGFLFKTNDLSYSYLSWLVLVYGGTFAGGFFFLIGSYANSRIAPTIVSTYYTTLPIFAAILEIIFYNRYISGYSVIGCILIVSGVLIVAYAKYKEQKKAQQIQAVQSNDIVNDLELAVSKDPVDTVVIITQKPLLLPADVELDIYDTAEHK